MVVNTCTVTELANKKSRQAIHKILNRTPQTILVAIGCYTQLKPDEVAEIEGVDYIFGSDNKMDLTEERPLDASGHDSVFVSAKTGQNVDELLRKIDQVLTGDLVQTTFAIPYDKGGITSALCGCGQVESMEYTETATILRGRFRREDLGRYRDYLMEDADGTV